MTELGTAGIQTGMIRRLLAAKVVTKIPEKDWNNIQRYSGGKQLKMQQFTTI